MARKTVQDSNITPQVALCEFEAWVNLRLEQASGYSPDSIARTIVNSLSADDLRRLSTETRSRLKNRISAGRITNAARRAVEKLSSADLVEFEYQSRMVITGPPDFVETTRSQLVTLSKLPIGSKLFRSLHNSGKIVTVVPSDRISEAPPENFRAALAKGKTLRWRDFSGKEKIIRGSGTGSNTTIKYNPCFTRSCGAGDWECHPPEIGLAHELIHANDSAYGQLDPVEFDGVRNYERQAIGLPPYEDKEFTENKFRAAWGSYIPARTRY